jgi:hypothetical protein
MREAPRDLRLEFKQAVGNYLANGTNRGERLVAQAIGVDRRTLHRWKSELTPHYVPQKYDALRTSHQIMVISAQA